MTPVDDWLIDRTDRITGWLQGRGWCLPSILAESYTGALSSTLLVTGTLSLHSLLAAGIFLGGGWPFLTHVYAELRRCQADAPRFDNPDLRSQYRHKATLERAFMIPRMGILLGIAIMVSVLGLAILANLKTLRLSDVAITLHFLVLGGVSYIRCALPCHPDRTARDRQFVFRPML